MTAQLWAELIPAVSAVLIAVAALIRSETANSKADTTNATMTGHIMVSHNGKGLPTVTTPDETPVPAAPEETPVDSSVMTGTNAAALMGIASQVPVAAPEPAAAPVPAAPEPNDQYAQD